MATKHSATHFATTGYSDSVNGKAQHTHIPRIYNGIDKTFNSPAIPAGGMVECGICGQVLMDSQT